LCAASKRSSAQHDVTVPLAVVALALVAFCPRHSAPDRQESARQGTARTSPVLRRDTK
jgi:hypothetical protein